MDLQKKECIYNKFLNKNHKIITNRERLKKICNIIAEGFRFIYLAFRFS